MIGKVDKDRIHRGLRYLALLDHKNQYAALCHSVALNSFVHLQLSRMRMGEYIILVTRICDRCVICSLNVLDDEHEQDIVARVEKELLENGSKLKCLICNEVENENGYCKLCSIMMTRVEETCPVCIDDTRNLAVWVKTECGHLYHHDCLARVSKCPMCRKVFEESPKII